MSHDQSADQPWRLPAAFNGLRNGMAHGRSPEKIAEEMRTVKAAYPASMTPEQAKD